MIKLTSCGCPKDVTLQVSHGMFRMFGMFITRPWDVPPKTQNCKIAYPLVTQANIW